MEAGSDSSDSVEVIDVDGPDVEEDITVYEGWVRSCPYLPPIARAELLAGAVAAIGNHPVSPAVTRSLQYWADQRPRIPARILADLISTETPSRGATSPVQVRNEVVPKGGTLARRNDLAPNRGTLHVHALGVVHPFDQVQHTIVPVFTLGDRMIAWREALPPRAYDAEEPPQLAASAGDVGLVE
jgi:hypothetical protein